MTRQILSAPEKISLQCWSFVILTSPSKSGEITEFREVIEVAETQQVVSVTLNLIKVNYLIKDSFLLGMH